MPWVRRSPKIGALVWLVSLIVGVVIGVLFSYERWGSTATLVDIVERELAVSQSHIDALEKRLGELEAKIGTADNGVTSSDKSRTSANSQPVQEPSQRQAVAQAAAKPQVVDAY
jgi:hypothetical protein